VDGWDTGRMVNQCLWALARHDVTSKGSATRYGLHLKDVASYRLSHDAGALSGSRLKIKAKISRFQDSKIPCRSASSDPWSLEILESSCRFSRPGIDCLPVRGDTRPHSPDGVARRRALESTQIVRCRLGPVGSNDDTGQFFVG
jgi:hypothetical protein